MVCVVRDRDHFEFAVIRTPELRFVFDLGVDWDISRRLIFEFIKQRVPGVPLGPKWEPPVGSTFAVSLLGHRSSVMCTPRVSLPYNCRSIKAVPNTPPPRLTKPQVKPVLSNLTNKPQVEPVQVKMCNILVNNSGVVESGRILGDERGGGGWGEGGPIHSETTTVNIIGNNTLPFYQHEVFVDLRKGHCNKVLELETFQGLQKNRARGSIKIVAARSIRSTHFPSSSNNSSPHSKAAAS